MSLIELLIVISLLSLFIGAVYESAIISLRAVQAAHAREQLRAQTAHALELLTREVSLASQIDTADAQSLQFDADLNGDGSAESNIWYQVQDGRLQRVYGGLTHTLIDDVSSFSFDYTDLNGTTMSPPLSGCNLELLRLVQITATATNENETLSLATAAFLRNNR